MNDKEVGRKIIFRMVRTMSTEIIKWYGTVQMENKEEERYGGEDLASFEGSVANGRTLTSISHQFKQIKTQSRM